MPTTQHNNYDIAAKKVIDRIGNTIVIGVPLGLGKPIGFLNALYRLASHDPSIQLTIITGLTLARPSLHNELEKRFVEPIMDRMLKDYEDPLYERARELQQLPQNIKVIEFFLAPGKFIHNDYVQQHYISSNYTSIVHDALHNAINVIGQQVAHSNTDADLYSLSCNTDLFKDIDRHLKEAQQAGKEIAVVAEVNENLPFMHGDAIIQSDTFTDIIDTGVYRTLFAIPRDELSAQDHLIGLYTSSLIKDDGCLQIGIGKLSNAVANALIMRHKHNADYQALLKELSVQERFGETITAYGGLARFEKGLYASTEMLSDEYLELYKEDILKKRTYDHIGLQKLLNAQSISETVTPEMLGVLLDNGIINARLTASDVDFLTKFGVFKSDIRYQSGKLILPSGEEIPVDLSVAKQTIVEKCLGSHLKTGKLIHAGFFFGSVEFYQMLHHLPESVLQQIDMTTVSRTNTVTWSVELSQLQRQHARLINSAMMATLGGMVVSDGLNNLQEVSGVGGQFDFVNMAHILHGARSIINLRSTRKTNKKMISNIIWEHHNPTIPRYLRDIVITEYGIADCRSKIDADVIKAMLNVADSHFQESLLKTAKHYGKIESDYEIPTHFQQNYSKKIKPIIKALQSKGYCKPYPFGSDLTDDEQVLQRVLLHLKQSSKLQLLFLLIKSLVVPNKSKSSKYLIRMNLNHPNNLKEYIYKKLIQTVCSQLGY